MTSVQRAHRVNDVARLLLAFLAQGGAAGHSGDLLDKFCATKSIDRTEAEVALSVLMNQGRVVANREMQLRPKEAAAA